MILNPQTKTFMINNNYSKKATILSFLVALSFFGFGYTFRTFSEKKQLPGKYNLSLFWEVWDILEREYPFEQPSPQEKIFGAITGLVDSYGDDYSAFFEPIGNKFFEQTISGRFAGAGMEIGIRSGLLTIISPLVGSPAEKAGFKPGDIITHVDEINVIGKTFTEVLDLIRGEIGTSSTITIVRPSESVDSINISFVRDLIQIPVLEDEVVGDTFVIHLYNFNESSEEVFLESLERFKESGKSQLILDMRNNPGGYLNSSINIASYFLPQGKVIVRESFGIKDTEAQTFRSLGYDLLSDHNYSLHIIINEGSASAAEIVAGALQEHGVARIVGVTSFGKGSVQQVIDLQQDTSLKLTIAKWLTPKGIEISNIGIKPDVVVYPGDNPVIDTQLEKAIELFNINTKD